jgi:hypothetical protein
MDANAQSEPAHADIHKRTFLVLWKSTAVKGITLQRWITGQTWRDGTGICESGGERAALTWPRMSLDSADGVV